MRTIALPTFTSLILIGYVSATPGITYALPGASEQAHIEGDSLNETIELGKYFEYEISGIEYNLGAGDNGSGWNPGNGKFKNNETETATVTVSVNGQQVLSTTLSTNKITEAQSGTIAFEEPIIIDNDTVSVSINYSTSMSGTSATFVSLQGTCLKDPPIPSGDLEVSNIVREGATPDVYWAINREGVYGTTPAVSVVGPAIGDHLESRVSGSSSNSSGCTKAPNAAVNKTNNGHGNNLDGVDVSNPGRSAEKWAARGIIDESIYDSDPTNDDDEGSGGGSAVSQQES